MSWWVYVLGGVVVVAVLVAGFRLRRSRRGTGRNYATGKKLRQSYKDKASPLPYDSTWLIEAAERQIPEERQIIESLRRSTTIIGFCPCGCGKAYFIDPNSRAWDFAKNVTLQGDGKTAVLDVMKDGRVGAVEEY